jgi:thiamine biosynthesis lipoprotein
VTATFAAMGCEIVVRGASDADVRRVRELFAERDARFSRFRPDSELARVNAAQGVPVLVSDELARMLGVALGAAEATGGVVTPTVGAAVVAAGYDRDFEELADDPRPPGHAEVPSWRRVRVAGRWLFRDGVVELDLNGVVKGQTVDDALALLPRGASVGAGGDVATTGPVVVALPAGGSVKLERGGLATSGTERRRWRRGGEVQHHLVDPATGRPSASQWTAVSVAAGSCVAADVAAKAAFLLDDDGPGWLDERGLPGRFVDEGGRVVVNGTWHAAHAAAAA